MIACRRVCTCGFSPNKLHMLILVNFMFPPPKKKKKFFFFGLTNSYFGLSTFVLLISGLIFVLVRPETYWLASLLSLMVSAHYRIDLFKARH